MVLFVNASNSTEKILTQTEQGPINVEEKISSLNGTKAEKIEVPEHVKNAKVKDDTPPEKCKCTTGKGCCGYCAPECSQCKQCGWCLWCGINAGCKNCPGCEHHNNNQIGKCDAWCKECY